MEDQAQKLVRVSADQNPIVCAIVVIYNGRRRDWLQKCFDSILSSTLSVKTIAIDNGSSDGSVEYIRENYPQVDLIEAGENLGFGRANNLAMKKAIDLGAEYFFLLNQDAWVEPETIATLVKEATNNPNFGIISPIHLNGEGTALDTNFANYVVPSECPEFLSDAVLGQIKEGLYAANFVNAAAWLLSRECLRRVGGFSPLFFHYGEDDNYCQRVSHKGLKVGIYPRCFVYHDRQERGEISGEESLRRRLVAGLVTATDPNARSSHLKRAQIMRDSLKVLYHSSSLSESIGTFEFYWQRKKQIDAAVEESRSNEEFLYIF